MQLREVDAERDAARIAEIYNHYIERTTVTFETEPLRAAQMRERILRYTAVYPWLVLEDDAGQVAAYAYASKYHERAAYRPTCEVSVYCAADCVGRGYGAMLLRALLALLRADKRVYTVVSIITGGNMHSLDVFRHLGFRMAGRLENAGRKLGKWIDVYHLIYQLQEYDDAVDETAGSANGCAPA